MDVSIHLLSTGKVDTRPLITHRYSLDDAQEAFEMSLKGDQAIKVMFLP
jgi:threonine dehydrogenase-like Zn-dependent dehydrogenase